MRNSPCCLHYRSILNPNGGVVVELSIAHHRAEIHRRLPAVGQHHDEAGAQIKVIPDRYVVLKGEFERIGPVVLEERHIDQALRARGGIKPVLDAGGSGHSVFADAFLGVLEENMSVLEAERLFWAVRTRVVSLSQKLNAEQIPTYDPIHMAGHESLGDFIFVPQGS